MANIKLIAESLQYHLKLSSMNESELNEFKVLGVDSEEIMKGIKDTADKAIKFIDSPKSALFRFLKDPEKNGDSFYTAYAVQMQDAKNGKIIRKICERIESEIRIELAKQSAIMMKADPTLSIPMLKISSVTNKIIGAGAVRQAKNSLAGEMGQ